MTLKQLGTALGLLVILFVSGMALGYSVRGAKARDWIEQAKPQIDSITQVVTQIDSIKHRNKPRVEQADSLIAQADQIAATPALSTSDSIFKLQTRLDATTKAFVLERQARLDAEAAMIHAQMLLIKNKSVLKDGVKMVAPPQRKLLGFIPMPEPYAGANLDLMTREPSIYAGVSTGGQRLSFYVEAHASASYQGVNAGFDVLF